MSIPGIPGTPGASPAQATSSEFDFLGEVKVRESREATWSHPGRYGLSLERFKSLTAKSGVRTFIVEATVASSEPLTERDLGAGVSMDDALKAVNHSRKDQPDVASMDEVAFKEGDKVVLMTTANNGMEIFAKDQATYLNLWQDGILQGAALVDYAKANISTKDNDVVPAEHGQVANVLVSYRRTRNGKVVTVHRNG